MLSLPEDCHHIHQCCLIHCSLCGLCHVQIVQARKVATLHTALGGGSENECSVESRRCSAFPGGGWVVQRCYCMSWWGNLHWRMAIIVIQDSNVHEIAVFWNTNQGPLTISHHPISQYNLEKSRAEAYELFIAHNANELKHRWMCDDGNHKYIYISPSSYVKWEGWSGMNPSYVWTHETNEWV